MSVLLMGGIIIYAVEIALCGVIYLSSFMKMDTGVQAILRFRLRNLRGCDVGIADGRDLWNAPLRWAQVV
jgi:hypothetical protein